MLKSLIRTLSFFSKWLAEIIREPALMLSLVLGPFLILLAFGAGTQIGAIPKPRTIVVSPTTPQPDQPLIPTADDISEYLIILGTTTDSDAALAQLRAGEADLVVVLPADPDQTVSDGRHAEVMVFTNDIDPLRNSYTNVYLYYQFSELNRNTLRRIIETAQQSSTEVQEATSQARAHLDTMRNLRDDSEAALQDLRQTNAQIDQNIARLDGLIASGQSLAPFAPAMNTWVQEAQTLRASLVNLREQINRVDNDLGGANERLSPEELARYDAQLTRAEEANRQFQSIPATVLSSPFLLNLENVAPFEPTAISFYAPAVLALLLQHLAVTLGALSMARVRLLGLMELLQTSPVRPSEVVVGNYLSYGLLCVIVSAALAGLLTALLAVPVVGSVWLVVGLLLLLIFSSLGIGFIISMVSGSEQQAAQLAMLVLIASVFFSGFMIFLDAINWPVRAISFALPATYAIRSLRDVMLRGVLGTEIDLIVLGVMGLAFFVVTLLLFRREFKPT